MYLRKKGSKACHCVVVAWRVLEGHAETLGRLFLARSLALSPCQSARALCSHTVHTSLQSSLLIYQRIRVATVPLDMVAERR